jgi:hypothetical protein
MTLKLLTTLSNIHKSIDEQWFFFARGELRALAVLSRSEETAAT